MNSKRGPGCRASARNEDATALTADNISRSSEVPSLELVVGMNPRGPGLYWRTQLRAHQRFATALQVLNEAVDSGC